MELILLAIYVGFGYVANQWVKYHLMNVRAEYTNDVGNFYLSRIIWALLLGWISIPVMVIGKLLGKGKK